MEAKMVARQLRKLALAEGSVEVRSGVWLQSAAHLTEEQKGWPDEDNCKNTDFSTFPLWIVTDSGHYIMARGGRLEDIVNEN
jgi:hypothetical protein